MVKSILPQRSDSGAGPVQVVLFDLDGTLIDTTDLIFQSYQHALGEVLGTTATHEELYLGYGQPLPEAFEAILQHRQILIRGQERAALIERLITSYRQFNQTHHDTLTREFPDVPSTLVELARRGYRLGLVTSKSRMMAERGLRLFGLDRCFQTTVCMEDSERHKPHPDPVWLALERLDHRDQPGQALYVGDSTHDLQAGRAAGVQTAAALWGPFPRESLLAQQPDYLLASIAELLEIL